MLTPIGEMRELVAVLTPVRTTDEAGGEKLTYTASDPLFIALRAVGTTEAVQFGQVNADVSHVAFGHWHDLNQLQSTNRIRLVETDAEFDITGGPINDPKRAWTRLNLVLRENG